MVKLLPCDQKVTGSNRGISPLQKFKVRLCTIDPYGSVLSQIPCIARALMRQTALFTTKVLKGT